MGVQGRGEQAGQQREEVPMLVRHEGPYGRATRLLAGEGLRPDLVLVEGEERRTILRAHVRALQLFGERYFRVVPGRSVRSPDMDLRPVGDLGVEAAQPQQHHRLGGAVGHDVRAAARAEAAELAGRGFEGAQHLRAADPAELLARHGRHRGEGGAMGLAAGPAMAMHDTFEGRIGLVGDGAAKTASGQHGGSS